MGAEEAARAACVERHARLWRCTPTAAADHVHEQTHAWPAPQEPLRDVRRALLEADVSLPVVRRFIAKVRHTRRRRVMKGA